MCSYLSVACTSKGTFYVPLDTKLDVTTNFCLSKLAAKNKDQCKSVLDLK